MDLITVEVAYATPEKQHVIQLKVATDTSIAEVIAQSGIENEFPALAIMLQTENLPQVGVFGKKIDPHTYLLQNGDRVEIYRPLAKTPNQKRLERAKIHATIIS